MMLNTFVSIFKKKTPPPTEIPSAEAPKHPPFAPGRPIRAYGKDHSFYDFSTDDLVGEVRNNFNGWHCGLGVDNLFIDMDGNIFGATCKVGGKYGNIFEEFSTPKNWGICTRKLCTCGSDLFIPKSKSSENKDLLLKTFSKEPTAMLNSDHSIEILATERVHDSDIKQVYWEIGRRCNFDCSYCSSNIHNKTDAHKTLTQLLNATEKVLDQFSGGQKVNFIISGGEPTLNPAFLDWVRYISSLGHALSMHSNGSRLPDYYKELIHYGNLNLSAHFEFYNHNKFLKIVSAVTAEKVRKGNKDVGHLEVKAMMYPGRREEALKLREDLLNIPEFSGYCTFAFVPIRVGPLCDQLHPDYTPEDFVLFGV